MAITTINGLNELRSAVGRELGTSEWLEITQERVNTFAEATGDDQWIHVDVERAKAESPFGGPIAHGYLTLSLTNLFLPEVVEVTGISSGVNYGVNKVRFPAAVPVGSRVRGHVKLEAAEDVRGGVQTTMLITVELEGSEKPACIVEAISRWLS